MTDKAQTFTLPEVAKLAKIQGDTLRMWYRRGYLEGIAGKGWKRYTLRDAACVSFYARVVRHTKDHEIAASALESFIGHVSEIQDQVDGDGLWLVFFRTSNHLTEQQQAIKAMREAASGQADPTELYLRRDEFDSEAQAFLFYRELITDETTYWETSMPIMIPVHRFWQEIAIELMDYLKDRESGGNS